jgi:hypothetical protein
MGWTGYAARENDDDVEAPQTTEARTTTYERQSGSNLVSAVVENSVLVEGLGRRTEYTYDDASTHALVRRAG